VTTHLDQVIEDLEAAGSTEQQIAALTEAVKALHAAVSVIAEALWASAPHRLAEMHEIIEIRCGELA
jgi:hypothetical protein